MIFPPARPAAAAAAAGSRASRWGGWQQQQRAGVARSGQVSFGHLYGALRPPCWLLCALGAVEVLTTANPSPPPPQGPGPAGTALCGSIGPGAWRGGSVSGHQEGNSKQEAPGGAPPRRGWAPPAGLWGPQGLCPFLGSTIGLTSRVLLRLKVDLYTLVRARVATRNGKAD